MSVYIEVNYKLLKNNKYISNKDEYDEFEASCIRVHHKIESRGVIKYGGDDRIKDPKLELEYLREKLEEFEYNVEPFENDLKTIKCQANGYIKMIRDEYKKRIKMLE